MKPISTTAPRNGEAGFTLSEALIAMLILMFGLASIFNLMIVATSSNSVANRASAATMIAAQQIEVLRSTPFSQLVDTDPDSLNIPCAGPVGPACSLTDVEGVGSMETRWLIQTLTNSNLRFLQVRTEARGFRARQTMADLTTIRSCTLGIAAGCNP
jgi:type II secretory pathway pseudopilin PulG